MKQKIRELELALQAKDEEASLLRSLLEESKHENSRLNETLREKDQLLASFSQKSMSEAHDISIAPQEATQFGMSLDESGVVPHADNLRKGDSVDGPVFTSPKLLLVESPRLSGEEIAFKSISDVAVEKREELDT